MAPSAVFTRSIIRRFLASPRNGGFIYRTSTPPRRNATQIFVGAVSTRRHAIRELSFRLTDAQQRISASARPTVSYDTRHTVDHNHFDSGGGSVIRAQIIRRYDRSRTTLQRATASYGAAIHFPFFYQTRRGAVSPRR